MRLGCFANNQLQTFCWFWARPPTYFYSFRWCYSFTTTNMAALRCQRVLSAFRASHLLVLKPKPTHYEHILIARRSIASRANFFTRLKSLQRPSYKVLGVSAVVGSAGLAVAIASGWSSRRNVAFCHSNVQTCKFNGQILHDNIYLFQ